VIRTWWFYAVLAVATIWHGLLSIVAGALGVRAPRFYDRRLRAWSGAILRGAGTPLVVTGADALPRDRPLVYASNHSSLFDICALPLALPGSLRFVAKQELARIPIFGGALVAAGNVVIDRAHPRQAHLAYEAAARTIAGGISTIVFPEGTRSRSGELLPFKAMPFGLAIVAQVPLVPVYVHNTFEILPKGARRLHPRPIVVQVGAPIDTTGLTLDDRQALRDRARAVIESLRARVDAAPVPG
jgi:1-acyl-sn-glycerol-3-phosphate acyltransferase